MYNSVEFVCWFVCYRVSSLFLDEMLPNSHGLWRINWDVPSSVLLAKMHCSWKEHESTYTENLGEYIAGSTQRYMYHLKASTAKNAKLRYPATLSLKFQLSLNMGKVYFYIFFVSDTSCNSQYQLSLHQVTADHGSHWCAWEPLVYEAPYVAGKHYYMQFNLLCII